MLYCGAVRIQGATLDTFPAAELAQEVTAPSTGTDVQGKNGLTLRVAGEAGQWVSINQAALAASSKHPSGFLLRDVTTSNTATAVTFAPKQSDGSMVQAGELPQLGLRFEAKYEPYAEGIRISGSIEDMKGSDRAISVYYALPFAGDSITWLNGLRSSAQVPATGEMSDGKATTAGATGKYAQLPLCASSNGKAAIALGVPMSDPAIYRFGYSADTKQIYLVFDFGLTKDTLKFPGKAAFSFSILNVDPQWGFRSALARYYATYPECFEKKTAAEGIWLFAPATMKNPEDFNFMFHEISGAPDKLKEALPIDDKLNIMSFRYTTPIPYNMNMPKGDPHTYEMVLKRLKEYQAKGDIRALAQDICGIRNEDGTFWHDFADLPWVNGARMAQCVDPDLPDSPKAPNRAHQNYNPQDKGGWYQKTTPFQPGAGLDGEYLDSLSMFANRLDFAKEHFKTADNPLTFARKTRTPCLVQDFSLTEFCKWESEDLHKKGKLLMANGQPGVFLFMMPYLDVVGREVRWVQKGKFTPEGDGVMSARRAICNQKPFLMLMNDDYSKIKPEEMKYYFTRSLFYGFYPSMFENHYKKNGKWVADKYFEMPELYERDRPLFKKYIPLIKQISMAGWQPLTGASSADPAVWVERFGEAGGKGLYLTVFNATPETKTCKIQIDKTLLKLNGELKFRELVDQRDVAVEGDNLTVELPTQEVALVELVAGK